MNAQNYKNSFIWKWFVDFYFDFCHLSGCSIGIIYNNVQYDQNEEFTIYNGTVVDIRGKFFANEDIYYEFTHHGGSNYHLVGFRVGPSNINVYPEGKEKYYFYNRVDYPIRNKNIDYLKSTVPIKTTIGVGYSTFEKTFYVIYENVIDKLTLINAQQTDMIKPYIWEANNDSVNDTLSINFGKTPFKYQMPGFKSYCDKVNQKLIEFTCKVPSCMISLNYFQIYVFLLIYWIYKHYYY